MKTQSDSDSLYSTFCHVAELASRCPLSRHEKILFLKKEAEMALDRHSKQLPWLTNLDDESFVVVATLALLGQIESIVGGCHSLLNPQEAVYEMIFHLVECERFYAPIGGLLGYYKETVQRIIEKKEEKRLSSPVEVQLFSPPFYDFRFDSSFSEEMVKEGLKALPFTAEVYTVGGAGERLGFVDEKTLEPLPVAYLPFLGVTLLERLFRDLQAREYLYEKTFHTSVTVPVVLMTSREANNDEKIVALLEEHDYFGRPRDSIFKVVQPLVPIIDFEGNFTLTEPGKLAMKPGGHGVLWRVLYLQGAFSWLEEKKSEHLIIRQINNPLSGLDGALFQLVGVGSSQKKSFGFASIPRLPGLTEGLNALCVWNEKEAAITNVEYTYFDSLLRQDHDFFKKTAFMANTNILYAKRKVVSSLAERIVAPGMLINVKGHHLFYDKGRCIEKKGARLESIMQNIADEIRDPWQVGKEQKEECFSTFINVHEREKLFSVTKKRFSSLKEAHETAEYCLFDWCRMIDKLLKGGKKITVPSLKDFDRFFHEGPSFLFSFHPALGPLWSTIRNKLQNVAIEEGAEMQLKMAEISLRSFQIGGSLSVSSPMPCGVKGRPQSIPKATFSHVEVLNAGLHHPIVIKDVLQGHVERKEECAFVLEEGAELTVENVTISGSFFLTIPRYTRVRVSAHPHSHEPFVEVLGSKEE